MGPRPYPPSQVIPEADIRDADKVRAKLTAEGFDGAITLRLVDATTKVKSARDPVPTAYYEVWGLLPIRLGGGSSARYYLTAEQKLQIECNIYSLQTGKLLWTGTSEVMQPHRSWKLRYRMSPTLSGNA